MTGRAGLAAIIGALQMANFFCTAVASLFSIDDETTMFFEYLPIPITGVLRKITKKNVRKHARSHLSSRHRHTHALLYTCM